MNSNINGRSANDSLGRRARAVCIVLALSLGIVAAGCRSVKPLALWNDSAPAKAALEKYVEAARDPRSPGYIPQERRIAVFDLDGTLFCERAPTYFDWQLFESRVLDDKTFKPTEAQKAAAEGSRFEGRHPELTKEREDMVAAAYAGMSPEEFCEYVRSFMDTPQPGFVGMKRGEAFFKPMLQVVEYLVENGFSVYVCTGSDRILTRALVNGTLPIAPDRVIGSDVAIGAADQDGADALKYVWQTESKPAFQGMSLVKNLQLNKVSAIIREIGSRPVLAFGNSMSDASMANYTISDNEYPALAFMLLCDDTVREYGKIDAAAKMREYCAKYGWVPVSMRDDWKTVYGEGVSKDSRSARP
ncbi:MAG: haloacid dehalogenase-like hydrolase [Kiritimatiellae bacterium]|nr:haloacid dehalogenase-like hydrolase [Kiritimatiellia bacterium]